MMTVAPETRHYPKELHVWVCGKGPQQVVHEQVKTVEPLGFSSGSVTGCGPSVRTSAKLGAIPPG